jgi:NADH-quinone oxidoreductase E subunit
MKKKEIDLTKLPPILEKYSSKRWSLIPLLQEIQETFGYVPPKTIEPIAESQGLFPSEVEGVATFYAGFSLEPKGRYVVRVCRGTACHVRGGKSILRLMQNELGLKEGETDEDYRFTLETVACLGACFLAPTMMVNRTYYGKLAPSKVRTILAEYGRQAGKDGV